MASEENSDGRKPPATTGLPPPLDQVLKCPRCDSSNTKFCYYNNYCLTQPRYFCKTCRRYWTKGGALRNIPIGGGCRKNKKAKAGSRLSTDPKESESGGLKFLPGISSAMDYHLGGLPFSILHSPASGVFNQFLSFGDLSSNVTSPRTSTSLVCSSALEPGQVSPLMGVNYPVFSGLRQGESGAHGGAVQEMAPASVHSNIASSIESLSSINQDLHSKLQQQRLASLLGADHHRTTDFSAASLMDGNHNQPQPNLFQTWGSSKPGNSGGNPRKGGVGENSEEWFFENSYNAVSGNGSSNNNNSNSWGEIRTWNELHHYSAQP